MAEFKYEAALERLEAVVTELDESEIPLEARLKKFEEGTKLARQLAKKLEQAKHKVEVLVKAQGDEPTWQTFDSDAAVEDQYEEDDDND
mgnify:CR=1 FL=1